jgi:hypothetical protein
MLALVCFSECAVTCVGGCCSYKSQRKIAMEIKEAEWRAIAKRDEAELAAAVKKLSETAAALKAVRLRFDAEDA